MKTFAHPQVVPNRHYINLFVEPKKNFLEKNVEFSNNP